MDIGFESYQSDDVEIVQNPKSSDSGSSGKINLSDELDNIHELFAAAAVDSKPSSWPFFVGNLVCFRPFKTSEWLNGKIEKIPGGLDEKENQSLISLVNNPTVTYEVNYCQDLIKSNTHKADNLNKLKNMASKVIGEKMKVSSY